MTPSEFDLSRINANMNFLAGTDEVGRGPLAGPVVAATVCLDLKKNEPAQIEDFFKSCSDWGITDSKKLTSRKRLEIFKKLGIDLEKLKVGTKIELSPSRNCSLSFSIVEISPALIDEINILRASLKAMTDSFENLRSDSNGLLLVDGNKSPIVTCQVETVVKGDAKSLLIGLASIIAKEYRDHLMQKLGEQYPGYGLENHAGYPTKIHREAIATLGVTPIHRKSFKGVREFLSER